MTNAAEKIDWYANRDDLRAGQTFMTRDKSVVRLDRQVPGDGTKWYVLDWSGSGWSYEDSTIEPGDLEDRLSGSWDVV